MATPSPYVLPNRKPTSPAAATFRHPPKTKSGPALLEYRTINPIIFLGFMGYVMFVYLQGGFRFPILGQIRFELMVGAVLSAIAVFELSGRARSPRTPITGWIGALVVVCCIMSLFTYSIAVSWDLFIDRVLKMMMLCVFIAAFVTSPKLLRWFFVAYLLSFLKMAQEGILGFITGSLVWENQGTPRLHGATPSYMHPNSFAGTQLGTIPFLVKLRANSGRWLRLLMLGQIFAAIFIVITTGSRTAYVALMLLAGFTIMQSKSRFRTLFLIGCLLIAAVPFVPPEYMDRFQTIFTQKDKEGASIEVRKQILEDAWALLKDHPFGVGVGAFPLVRTIVFGRSQPAHNLYFEVALDLGIQGFIIFLGFVIAMLVTARRLALDFEAQISQLMAWKPASGPEPRGLASHLEDFQMMGGVSRAIIFFLVIRLGLGIFGHDFYELYWWFAAGLLLALNRLQVTAAHRTIHYLESPAPVHPAQVKAR